MLYRMGEPVKVREHLSAVLCPRYNHTVDCGASQPTNISVALPPVLFNLTADPCTSLTLRAIVADGCCVLRSWSIRFVCGLP